MAWVFLIVAILLEVSGTVSMKVSAGFTRLTPSVLMFVFYIASLSCLTIAIKTINLGPAYAMWAGLGVVLIVIVGAIYFNEPMSLVKLFLIALVVIGAVGLKLLS